MFRYPTGLTYHFSWELELDAPERPVRDLVRQCEPPQEVAEVVREDEQS